MLLPPETYPQEPEALAIAAGLIREIEAACGENQQNPPALLELRKMTGNASLDSAQYFEISGAMSYEDAALLAFCPAPKPIAGLSYEQFCEICSRMLDRLTDGDFEYWFALFCANARCSHPGDLVFEAPQEWIDRLIASNEVPDGTVMQNFEPTAEQLAKEAWTSDAIRL